MALEPPAKRKCMGDDCKKDAGTLQCPTCLKLDMKESYFCSQDCFKRNWASLFSIAFLTNTLYTSSCHISFAFCEKTNRSKTNIHFRVLIKHFIRRVTSSAVSLPQKSFLNLIQLPVYITPSQPIPIPVRLDPSIPYQIEEKCQNQYSTPTTLVMEYQGVR